MVTSKKSMIRANTAEQYKKYDYSLNNVTLNFSLRVDIKQERKDFLALLKRAVSDIEKELKS